VQQEVIKPKCLRSAICLEILQTHEEVDQVSVPDQVKRPDIASITCFVEYSENIRVLWV